MTKLIPTSPEPCECQGLGAMDAIKYGLVTSQTAKPYKIVGGGWESVRKPGTQPGGAWPANRKAQRQHQAPSRHPALLATTSAVPQAESERKTIHKYIYIYIYIYVTTSQIWANTGPKSPTCERQRPSGPSPGTPGGSGTQNTIKSPLEYRRITT